MRGCRWCGPHRAALARGGKRANVVKITREFRKAGIKITFAPIIVKFGKKEVAPNILLIAKVEKFRESFGNFGPENPIYCIIT